MANTFKVSTRNQVATAVSDNTAPIYTAPSSPSTTTIVLSLLLSNIHTTSIKVSVVLSSDTAFNTNAGQNQNVNNGANEDVHIIKNVTVEEETSLEIMSGQKYVLQPTDIIKVYADNANVDVVLSYMEITP